MPYHSCIALSDLGGVGVCTVLVRYLYSAVRSLHARLNITSDGFSNFPLGTVLVPRHLGCYASWGLPSGSWEVGGIDSTRSTRYVSYRSQTVAKGEVDKISTDLCYVEKDGRSIKAIRNQTLFLLLIG